MDAELSAEKKRTCQKPGTCGSGRQFLHRVLDQCIHGVCSVENGQQRNRRFNNTGLDDTVREADRELQTISGSRIRWVQGGKSGKATAAQACLLLKRLKTKLPGVPIYYISIAPSIRRWNLWKENQICNKAVSSFCSKTSGVSFIHCTPYLLKNGKLRKELYRSDQLHFNQKGYQVWNQVIPARIKKDLK